MYTQNDKGLLTLKTNYLSARLPLVSGSGVGDGSPQSVRAVDTYPKLALVEVDVLPEFPGGMNQARMFLANNIQYPAEAEENEVEGTVMVKFIVEIDGSISNIVIVNKLGYGCDKEVIRVLKKMPKWKPGELKGKPVRTYFALPVSFKLQ